MNRGHHRSGSGWGIAWCLLLLPLAEPAAAQGTLSVVPVQSLRFGTLTPGLATVVSPGDEGRAAIEVSGKGRISVSFTLPTGLQTSSGGFLPLRFGSRDGRVQISGETGTTDFDPNFVYRFSLQGPNASATVFLGGTALPESTQPPGAYGGEITLTVTISNGTT